MRIAIGVLVSLLAACGPSSGQIREARNARYETSAGAVFDAAMTAAHEHGGVAEYDANRGALRTIDRWYQQDGTSESITGDGKSLVEGGSILLSLMLEVKCDHECWVEITPLVAEHVSGSPQARELAPDDPAMPGWVQGKIDNLYLAIHEQLKARALPPPTP